MNTQSDLKKNDHSIWSWNFTLLTLSNFFLFFGAEMLSPVLPVYLFQNGGNNTQIGIVMGSFTFSSIIIRLLSIKATEFFGKRVFLMTGLFVCALAAGGYYLASAIILVFLLRTFHGFGFGAATTLLGAIVSNIIPNSRMGEGMGIFGLGITIAAAIGPFIGATVVISPNYNWIFLFSSGLIISAIFLTKISTAGGEPADGIKNTPAKSSTSDFLETRVLLPSVLVLLLGISIAGIFTYIVLFSHEAGIKKISVFFLIASLSEFLIRPFAGRLYDMRGHFIVLVPGALACGSGTILLSITGNMPMLITSSIFYGIGLGALFPVLEAWALKSVEPDRRVAANATFYNFLDVGIGIGSVMLGVIAQASDYSSMYFYSSYVFILFLFIYLIYCYGHRK